jgi:uncharacterized protein YlxW (UPF0749 family)
MNDEREQALHYAARLRGLSLIRNGNRFSLAKYLLTNASLDDVASYLAEDDDSEPAAPEGDRRASLRALIKAERALLAEMERVQQAARDGRRDRAETDTALAEIRRRLAELQTEMGQKR